MACSNLLHTVAITLPEIGESINLHQRISEAKSSCMKKKQNNSLTAVLHVKR